VLILQLAYQKYIHVKTRKTACLSVNYLLIAEHYSLKHKNYPPKQVPFLRRKLGLIFQDYKLLFDRTVFDNIALPLIVAGVGRHEVARRVRAALDKVGLLGKENKYPLALRLDQDES
jgi:cell division transport system ATP-binding protein